MSNTKYTTTIRIGAAHYDLRMKVGTASTHVNLANVLSCLHPRDRMSRLSGIAEIVCKVHDIRAPKTPPVEKKKRTKGPTTRVTRNYLVQSLTMEATL